MNYNKIKEILTSKGMSIPQLAEKIGMSKAGIYLALDKKRLSIDTIEKIAEVLDVPVTVFFDSERIVKLQNILNEARKQIEANNHIVQVNSSVILSMGVSFYQYLNTLNPIEKEALQKSEFGKKIENLLKIDWDNALEESNYLSELIEGKQDFKLNI